MFCFKNAGYHFCSICSIYSQPCTNSINKFTIGNTMDPFEHLIHPQVVSQKNLLKTDFIIHPSRLIVWNLDALTYSVNAKTM